MDAVITAGQRGRAAAVSRARKAAGRRADPAAEEVKALREANEMLKKAAVIFVPGEPQY